MAGIDAAVMEQITAIVTAIQEYQAGVLDAVELDREALLAALAALGDIDVFVEQKVLELIGQPSSYFNNLTQLIKDILTGMPDLSGFVHTVADRFMLDEPAEISFGGATTASSDPIVYRLSNPVNCTVAKYELAPNEVVELVPLAAGAGSITVTVLAGGVPASSIVITFDIFAGEIDVDAFTHTVASSYQAGDTETVEFGGAVSTDGSPVIYRLTDLVGVSASATEVEDGGSVALTMTGAPGSRASMTVTPFAGDIEGEPQVIAFDLELVTVDISGLQHTVASQYLRGAQAVIRFSGAVASDGSAVTYRLSNLVGCSVSKSTGIADNEEVEFEVTGSTGLIAVRAESGSAESAVQFISFSITTAQIDRPRITAPLNGATGVSVRPVLASSAFGTLPVNSDDHVRSRWKILRSNGTVVWQSGAVSSLTAISVPVDLPAGEELRVLVQHEGRQLGWSEWAHQSSFTTAQSVGLGTVLDGGWTVVAQYGGRWLAVLPQNVWVTGKAWGAKSDSPLPNHDLPDSGSMPLDEYINLGWNNSIVDSNPGSYNTSVIRAYYGSSAAAAGYCVSKGGVLPSKNQLAAIMESAHFSHSLPAGAYILSSTEMDESFVWHRSVEGYEWSVPKENSRSYVMPVKEVV